MAAQASVHESMELALQIGGSQQLAMHEQRQVQEQRVDSQRWSDGALLILVTGNQACSVVVVIELMGRISLGVEYCVAVHELFD